MPSPDAVIDWTIPPGRPDWLLGTGAGATERALVWLWTVLAVVVLGLVARSAGVDWTWWQWAVAAALTVDVAGGVPANALGTAKRFYHSPVPPRSALPLRVVHDHVGFAALHVHPFLVAAAFPDASLPWAATWYLTSLAGTVAVVAVPLHLRRPLAAGITTVAILAAPLVVPPAGLAWLGPVLVLKLVAAHAVREEPYRPARP